jgi:hypothetical protein
VFRRYCRSKISNVAGKRVAELNALFLANNLPSFWRKLCKKVSPSSCLHAKDFAETFSNVMTDVPGSLSPEQAAIARGVDQLLHSTPLTSVSVDVDQIVSCIKNLKNGTAAGPDDISPEHLTNAKSDSLVFHLADCYRFAFSHQVVPMHLKLSRIVPVLKKPSLNPNDINSYRPITVSSVFAKLAESLMMPNFDSLLCNTQFGFRHSRDTMMACSFINDTATYFNAKGSAVYLCSLDAERCFDKIWHEGLFHKLHEQNIFRPEQWCFLLRWYRSSLAFVSWTAESSPTFAPTRGTKQGSLLSPLLFNAFINDLLSELQNTPAGIRIGPDCYNSIAYADDISLIAALPNDLQSLIDVCTNYADRWRFTYGLKKTKCMTIGKCMFQVPPQWTLKDHPIAPCEETCILGVHYSQAINASTHLDQRTRACPRAMLVVR